VKTLLAIAAALPLAVSAQDLPLQRLDKMKEDMAVHMKMLGAVKGMTVKGAPYSGEEVNETNQTLADGTRIHRETRTTVYRDSEGRTRRDMPESITINDPVAGVTYVLNPKTMTGQKLNMSAGVFAYRTSENTVTHSGADGTHTATFSMHISNDNGAQSITVNGEPLDKQALQEFMSKARINGDRTVAVIAPDKLPAAATVMKRLSRGEPIGKQTIEGVEAEGMRTVNTIKAGEIGNDRDIQVTGESWYSEELKTTVMTKHSDPRTGEESFRLTNIRRGEPGAYLFQPPSGYTIKDPTERKF